MSPHAQQIRRGPANPAATDGRLPADRPRFGESQVARKHPNGTEWAMASNDDDRRPVEVTRRKEGETAAQHFSDQLIRAAGVLLFKEKQPSERQNGSSVPDQFLLMKHKRRWDLPKGHVDPGESEFETAVRELEEETGIPIDAVEFLEPFQYEIFYVVRERQFSPDPLPKRVTFYLARLVREVPILVTEHQGFEWLPWNPPHRIQPQTVDPLLAAAEKFFAESA